MEVNIGESINQFFASIDWSQPSWDLFIVLFFLVAALIYGISLGRDRIIVIMVSIYMAVAVINFAPYVQEVNTTINVNDNFALQVTTFLGIFVALFFFLSQSALLRTLGSRAAQGAWWQIMIFSILQAGLMISVVLSFLPAESIDTFNPLTKQLFVDDVARGAWITAPIIAMAFMPGLKYEDD